MSIEAMKIEGPLHVICQCDKCKAEKQEPVAWIVYSSSENDIVWANKGKRLKQNTPLYTHPQPKAEQEPKRRPSDYEPLTDEQIYSMVADITDVRNPYLQFARAIEAAHGITASEAEDSAKE